MAPRWAAGWASSARAGAVDKAAGYLAAKKVAAKPSAVDKAAAYLAAKKAAAKPAETDVEAKLQDARASVLAGKANPKQAAAKQYLELRKKQQAAHAYLAARRATEADEIEE